MMKIPLIFMLVALLVLGGRSAQGADGTDSKHRLQRIKRELREKKREIKRADRKERSILSELDTIDRDIQTGSTELADQQQQLRASEADFRTVERNNAAIAGELEGLKRRYALRLRALYKMSRRGYVATLLTADGMGTALKRIKYLGIIAERDRTVMREYAGALAQLAARQADIAEKKGELLARNRTIEIQKAALEGQRRNKAAILADVREEKGLYEQTLRELEASSAELWAMIKRNEREKKAAKAAVASSPRMAAVAPGSRLPWPIEGRVLTPFGMQRHPQFGIMVFRRGIEIEAKEGDSVRAVSDGQVAYADWYKGYGKLMIIDHGGGFYTLYGYLSKLDLGKGDHAAKGQVIGQAGETGSLKGTKLYFEIRRSGEAQNPVAWLAIR
jgi:septal ring factor EnvC (AmiA/AmiB activator)